MKNIFAFLRNPKSEVENQILQNKLRVFWNAFLFLLLARLIFGVIAFIAKKNDFFYLIDVIHSYKGFNKNLSQLTIIILLVIEAPIIEEIAFRGMFTKNKKIVCFSLASFFVLILNMFLTNVVHYLISAVDLWIVISTSLLLVIIIYLLLLSVSEKVTVYFNNNYRLFIYLSIILFSSLHILNYNPNKFSVGHFLAILAILIPYLALAISLTYVRVKNGLSWSIAFHSLNNLFVAISLIITNPHELLK